MENEVYDITKVTKNVFVLTKDLMRFFENKNYTIKEIIEKTIKKGNEAIERNGFKEVILFNTKNIRILGKKINASPTMWDYSLEKKEVLQTVYVNKINNAITGSGSYETKIEYNVDSIDRFLKWLKD